MSCRPGCCGIAGGLCSRLPWQDGIAAWPSKQFYSSKMTEHDEQDQSDATLFWRSFLQDYINHYCGPKSFNVRGSRLVIDVGGHTAEGKSGLSQENPVHVRVVQDFVVRMHAFGVFSPFDSKQLADTLIHSPYQGQVTAYKRAFAKMTSAVIYHSKVEVRTTTKTQGHEAHIVISDYTRSNSMGFTG